MPKTPESDSTLLNSIALEFHHPERILACIGREAAVDRPTEATSPISRRPQTHVEVTVHDIWGEVLNIGECGVDDDFFGLGGCSLLAVQMFSRVQERFAVELPLDVVFNESLTIATIAGRIEQYLRVQASAGEVLKT